MPELSKSQTDKIKELEALKQEVTFLKEKDGKNMAQIESLKRKLLSFELAASGAKDGLWDWDLVKDEVFISGPWLEMLGYDQGDFTSILGFWASRLHPEDKQEAIATFKDCMEGNQEEFEVHFRMKHKNGSYRWIESRGKVLKDSRGEIHRISGSHTDITDSMSVKDALGKSERKYLNLFENSLFAMFRTKARTGEILYANPIFWQILGTDPKEGTSALNFYANPEDRANFLNDLRVNGKVEDREIKVRKANQEITWVSVSAVYYPEENIIEGVMMDISNIKDSLVELQKVNYELDHFVYHASHDLRSPLRSIMGLLNLLRLEKSAAARENCLELIEGSINRLDNLVIDLLQISKGNRANNPVEEISMVTEVNNSITNFYHVEDSEDIRIITKIYQPIEFTSDLTRVRIILNNLISNAIKYRDADRQESFIIVEAVINENKAIITIEDNGEGIEKSKLPSIFDMFVRATDNNQGSGLGLYIVKNVVEKLGGTIVVESEENRGTIFKVELPNMAA